MVICFNCPDHVLFVMKQCNKTKKKLLFPKLSAVVNINGRITDRNHGVCYF